MPEFWQRALVAAELIPRLYLTLTQPDPCLVDLQMRGSCSLLGYSQVLAKLED